MLGRSCWVSSAVPTATSSPTTHITGRTVERRITPAMTAQSSSGVRRAMPGRAWLHLTKQLGSSVFTPHRSTPHAATRNDATSSTASTFPLRRITLRRRPSPPVWLLSNVTGRLTTGVCRSRPSIPTSPLTPRPRGAPTTPQPTADRS